MTRKNHKLLELTTLKIGSHIFCLIQLLGGFPTFHQELWDVFSPFVTGNWYQVFDQRFLLTFLA